MECPGCKITLPLCVINDHLDECNEIELEC